MGIRKHLARASFPYTPAWLKLPVVYRPFAVILTYTSFSCNVRFTVEPSVCETYMWLGRLSHTRLPTLLNVVDVCRAEVEGRNRNVARRDPRENIRFVHILAGLMHDNRSEIDSNGGDCLGSNSTESYGGENGPRFFVFT